MSHLRNELQLQATIHNLEQESAIWRWVALTAPHYGTKPFNKRFETWLNKESMSFFGEETVQRFDGMQQIPKIRFGFRKSDYSDYFEFSFYYPSQTVAQDYDTHTFKLRDGASEREYITGIHNLDELVGWADKIPANRQMERAKAQGNLRDLAKLEARKEELSKLVTEYNDSISYCLGDAMRLRVR
jgi:hypothetical protein